MPLKVGAAGGARLSHGVHRLDALGDDVHRGRRQPVRERFPDDWRRIEHIQCDVGGVRQKRLGARVCHEVVEREGIAFRLEVAAGGDHLGVHDDVLVKFDHDDLCWQQRGGVLEEERPGEVQERGDATRKRIESDAEQRIRQDTRGRQIASGGTRPVGALRPIEQLVAAGAPVDVHDGLAGDVNRLSRIERDSHTYLFNRPPRRKLESGEPTPGEGVAGHRY